jgi:hypothetical protein
MTMSLTATGPTMTAPAPRRLATGLLAAQFAGMWGAFFILSAAINWPASLDEQAGVMLPLIREQAGPVFSGYLLYLLHAVLLIPLAVLLRHTLRMSPVMGGIAIALGVLAGFAKTLGIIRWLVLMPGLALAWADPATGEAGRQSIAAIYDAFNAYAGGVGELMGVGLFAGLWTVLLSVALVRLGGGARILGLAGFAAAGLLFATLPSVVNLTPPLLLTLSGVAWQLWTLALAVWHLRTR